MKSSHFWFNWLRSALAFLLTLGFFGWTSAPVSAAVEYNEKIPFTDDFDACSGEQISVDGIQHIVGRFTKDANAYSNGCSNLNTDTHRYTDFIRYTYPYSDPVVG